MNIKLQLIDRAYNVLNFDNQASELVYALSEHMQANDEEAIYYGFKLALEQIEQYPEVIQPTLYRTMEAVKRYRQLVNRGEYDTVNAVSLATNHLFNIIQRRKRQT